jgi:hypothetical protein
MRLSPENSCSRFLLSRTAAFGGFKSPAKPLKNPPALATPLKGDSARSTLEYENPDLMQPSVSSF